MGGDPHPDRDGSLIDFGRQALEHQGVCTKNLWPYERVPQAENVTQQTDGIPSEVALLEARQHCLGSYFNTGTGSGAASHVYDLLVKTQQPIAVSLPVFVDESDQARDNWNSQVGLQFGRILDPPPTAVVVGGHAVCILGFVPDELERTGGHFIFRNSWGADWAYSAPCEPYHSPMPGYGQVSATYVDKFLWEMCALDMKDGTKIAGIL